MLTIVHISIFINDFLEFLAFLNLIEFVVSGNGNGASKVFESDGNAGLPKPSVVLYDRKLDFSVCSNRTIGCGFVNLGNTCFLSSTLQCLCHLPPWFNYIISDHHLSNCKLL